MGKFFTDSRLEADPPVGLRPDELESVGLTPVSLEAAIARAKERTRHGETGRRLRRRIESNPELERWFD